MHCMDSEDVKKSRIDNKNLKQSQKSDGHGFKEIDSSWYFFNKDKNKTQGSSYYFKNKDKSYRKRITKIARGWNLKKKKNRA